MNINMLRDTDDDPGFYVAVTSPDPKWPGCALFQSSDNGVTYQRVSTITAAATMGRVIGKLSDFGGGHIPDETSVIKVALTRGSLSSVPYASFLNGVQAAIIGDEIVYFRDVTLNSDGTYTVSGFLRGMRGSEYAMGAHGPGERFILVDASTMTRIPGVTADLHVPRLYKAVTAGGTLAKTTAQSFTNDGAGLKPYAPAQIGGGQDADGNLLIKWVRRTRVSGEWRNNVDVPLGETSEAYEIDIMDASFTTVKRTITGLTSPTATYSAADQAADGIGSSDPVYLQVYQLSATVGRGYPGKGALRHSGEIVSGGGSGGGADSGGSSGGTGSSTVTPVPTGIANGSTVTLARGTIYQGTLDLSGKTGVSVVVAAGTGAAPVISPGQAITGWTVHSGSIYKASVGFVPVQVSLSDVPVKRASWPASGWASSTSGMPNTDVTGATLYQLTNQSVINSSVLSSNTIPTSVPFYVEGKLWMLTSAGAWAYDSGVLYLWAPDGATPEGRAWASPNQPGINADNSSGVSITGISVISASVGISGASSTNLHVTGGSTKNLSKDGVYAGSSSGLVVDGVAIVNARENGVNAFYGSNNVTVKNCAISNTGMVGNPCPSLGGIFIGGPNTGTVVQNNTVTNSAYHGISVNQNRNSSIVTNTVDGFCKVLHDGGGIYTQSTDRSALTMTISGNTVRSGVGSEVIGIYLDDGSNGVTVTGNTMTGNNVACLLHNAFNNTVTLNSFSGNTVTNIRFSNSGSGATTTYGNQINHNTMSLSGEQAYNLDAGSSFSSWATWANNTYTSANPSMFAHTWDGVSSGLDRSYTAWTSLVGETGSTMNGA